MNKYFITKIGNELGPILENSTWVKAQYEAYNINEELKVIGYTNDKNDLNLLNYFYKQDNDIEPTENIIKINV